MDNRLPIRLTSFLPVRQTNVGLVVPTGQTGGEAGCCTRI